MGCLSNIKKLYCVTLFHSLIPAYVIERLFWRQRGMSVQMVVYTEIIYALTVTSSEIPTGILADRFGRKKMLTICGALSAAELILLLFARSFWQFAAAVFLSGIGKALSSGSDKALLYDSLCCAGMKKSFEKILGRLTAVDLAGSMTAALCGSVLANFFPYELNYILSVLSMCTAFAVTLTLREPPIPAKPENGAAGVKLYAGQALGVFRSQPLVLLYCLTGAVLGACLIYLDEFWQIALENIGVPVFFFGVVSALLLTIRIPGSVFAYRLKEKFGYNSILTCIIGVSAAGYAAVFMARNAFCLVPMAVIFLAAGVMDPLIAGYLHHRADSRIRATAESFSSLGLRAASAGVGLLFGYLSAEYSVFAGFLALGAVCLAYLVLFGLARRIFTRRREK